MNGHPAPPTAPAYRPWMGIFRRYFPPDRYTGQYRMLGPAVGFCMYICEILAAVCMVVLLAVAVFSIMEAIVAYFVGLQGIAAVQPGESELSLPPGTKLLVSVVKSIELIFLAPLPFLLAVGIGKYTDQVLMGNPTKEAKHELQTVKSFTAALFISVTTAHAVQEIVQGSVKDTWYFAGIVALILALTLYLLILEKFGD